MEKEKFLKLCKIHALTKREFCVQLGINESVISRALSNKNNFSPLLAAALKWFFRARHLEKTIEVMQPNFRAEMLDAFEYCDTVQFEQEPQIIASTLTVYEYLQKDAQSIAIFASLSGAELLVIQERYDCKPFSLTWDINTCIDLK